MTQQNEEPHPGGDSERIAEDTIKHLRDRGYTITEEYSNTGQLSKVSGEHPPRKTWWDWLQLLAALAIPVVIALGTAWFSYQQNQTSLEVGERQHQTDIQIANDQQQEAALQTYLNNMSDLLLTKHLRESGANDEVRNVARSITLAVLHRLDGKRKENVLLFLSEAGLIDADSPIIILGAAGYYGADLSGVDFSGIYNPTLYAVSVTYAVLDKANLTGVYLKNSVFEGSRFVEAKLDRADMSGDVLLLADLTGAQLRGADLTGAGLVYTQLRGADLTGAKLTGADLTGADLTGANLTKALVTQAQLDEAKSLKGTIMPNGSIHP